VLKQVKESVEGGSTLAEALKKFPKYFDDLFVNMIAAGEAGGILDAILRRLAAYMEKAARLKSKVKGAMTYPLVTLAIAVIVLAVILIFVIPVFEEMFADFGSELPAPTAARGGDERIGQEQGSVPDRRPGALCVRFQEILRHRKRPRYRGCPRAEAAGLRDAAAQGGRGEIYAHHGDHAGQRVAILEALDIVAKTAGNRTIEKSIYSVRSGISEGRTMADPLNESGVFPPMVCQMIAVGESTGALDAMLEKIADFYDEEVDQAVENMTALIEPVMLVFLGVTIGGLVVAMYLPIFKMAGAIS
jgi:type IV pilus assembly protein PilC